MKGSGVWALQSFILMLKHKPIFKVTNAVLFFLWLALLAVPPSYCVSFQNEIQPILQRSCVGCHHPSNLSGELDLTGFASLNEGGKQGVLFKAGKPESSLLLQYISGEDPLMPLKGEPLTAEEVDLFRRWIEEGAKDDLEKVESKRENEPISYTSAPVISALAYSPDGTHLAVSGYHEVLVWNIETESLISRLPCESDRITSIAFSPDGNMLAAVGGSPSQFGEFLFWYLPTSQRIRSAKVSHDTLYGASFSPNGKWLAFGGADKKARIVNCPFGDVLVEFENHDDWVFATTFSQDGKHLITGSRDKAIKLIDAETGSFIDDINASNKGYGSVQSLDRHPQRDQVVIAGDDGIPRLYNVFRKKRRDKPNTDLNLVREYERIVGGINVVRFSSNGELIAAGGIQGKVNLYATEESKKRFSWQGDSISVYSLEFHPTNETLAVGGFDGMIQFYDTQSGEQIDEMSPFVKQTAFHDKETQKK